MKKMNKNILFGIMIVLLFLMTGCISSTSYCREYEEYDSCVEIEKTYLIPSEYSENETVNIETTFTGGDTKFRFIESESVNLITDNGSVCTKSVKRMKCIR